MTSKPSSSITVYTKLLMSARVSFDVTYWAKGGKCMPEVLLHLYLHFLTRRCELWKIRFFRHKQCVVIGIQVTKNFWSLLGAHISTEHLIKCNKIKWKLKRSLKKNLRKNPFFFLDRWLSLLTEKWPVRLQVNRIWVCEAFKLGNLSIPITALGKIINIWKGHHGFWWAQMSTLVAQWF